MKKSDYTGWQEVFYFSLIQGMKGNAYICFLVLAAVILLASGPVTGLIDLMDTGVEVYHSGVTDFTIYDEVDLPIDYSKSLTDFAFINVKINSTPTQTFEEHVKALEEKSKDKGSNNRELIVQVVYEEAGYFNLTFVKAANAAVKGEDCKKLAQAFIAFFDEARINAIDVSQEQLDFLNRPVASELKFVTDTGEVVSEKRVNEGISMEEYMLLTIGIIGVLLVITLSGNSIATSIVTEKSTRVVEYLTINVRPLALIMGKILAVLLMVLVQLVVMGASYGMSTLLRLVVFGTDADSAVTSTGEAPVEVSAVMNLLSDIGGMDIVVAVAVILGGILFYCILAGLAGASVSRLEEMNEGLKLYNMLVIVGTCLGIVMCVSMLNSGDNQLFINICSLLPISSPFVVPICVLIGKLPMGIALTSLVILLIVTGFLFSFTAKVYEALIFYNGNAMKFKDIWQIAMKRKIAEKKGEKYYE